MVYARRNVALRDKVAVAAPLRAYRSAAKDDEALFIALDSCVWHLTSGTWHLPPATRHPPPAPAPSRAGDERDPLAVLYLKISNQCPLSWR